MQLTYTIHKRISDLVSIGIVHMDLHFGNILLSKKNNRLYIIDFGLALNIHDFFIEKKLNMKYLKEKWFEYRTDWSSWPIEYILISLMVKEEVVLTKKNIMSTIKNYYRQNKTIGHFLDETYIKHAYSYFKSFAHHSNEQNTKHLLKFANTWDDYKLAYNILSYIYRNYIKFVNFEWLLLLMIHPNPEFRPTTDELKEHFETYLQLNQYESLKIHKHTKSVRIQAELSKSIKDD